MSLPIESFAPRDGATTRRMSFRKATEERRRVLRWLERKGIHNLNVPLAALSPHPGNPRDPLLGIELGELEELARSLHAVGQIYPLTVTTRPDRQDRYWIVDGITRYTALQECQRRYARARDAWCAVRELDRAQATAVSYGANLTHRNSVMELAYGFARLYEDAGTDAAVAEITGYSRSTVVAYRNLAVIPRAWLDVMAAPIRLSVREARALRKVAEKAAENDAVRSCVDRLIDDLGELPKHHPDRTNDAVIRSLKGCRSRRRRKQAATWEAATLSVAGRPYRNALRYRDVGDRKTVNLRLSLPADTDIGDLRGALQSALNSVVGRQNRHHDKIARRSSSD